MRGKRLLVGCLVLLLGAAWSCAGQGAPRTPVGGEATMIAKAQLSVHSPSFAEGASIPARHSCDGADVSPPLSWQGVPSGTRSLAVICHDPDAPGGDWVHWVAWNIPASRHELAEHVPQKDRLADGTCQGRNDFRKVGYNGPCPPKGTHRYYYRVYALDVTLDLAPGKATRDQLVKAMGGHVLAEGALMGRFSH